MNTDKIAAAHERRVSDVKSNGIREETSRVPLPTASVLQSAHTHTHTQFAALARNDEGKSSEKS